jgi:hypothetical protein
MEKCRHDYRSDGRSYCYCIKCGKNKYEKGHYFRKESEQMAIKNGAKHKTLRYLITNFSVEIGFKADKERYNKAWHKLWCGIAKIGLFTDDTKNKRSK